MRFILSAFFIFSVLLFAGCRKTSSDPARTPISGSVVYDGEMLRAGIITFTSEDDPFRQTACMIFSDGTFSVENVPKGKVLISVDTATVSPELGGSAEFYREIPKKYADMETSGLSLDVPPGGLTEYVITLQK